MRIFPLVREQFRKVEDLMNRSRLLTEKNIIFVFLAVFFLLFSVLASLSEGSYGGADDISHYKFARYAFQMPALLLDHWAKPFFTLLSAPFAQFGFIGMRFFNIIIGLITSFLSFKVAQKLRLKNAVMVIFFVLLSTLYPALMLSGMTEVLFSFLLVLSIYLALHKKYLFSAIILSFLPFVRTEGILFFVLFGIVFLYEKQYFQVLFLFTGLLIYSVIGGFYFDDFLWIIHQMPYGDATDIYGTGNLFHFIEHSKNIFGIILSIFIFLGIYLIIYFLFRKPKNESHDNTRLFLFILLPASAYYWAHSFSWYLGIGSSLGLIRVMAGVIPLFGIIALLAYNFIVSFIPDKSVFRSVFAIILVVLLAHSSMNLNTYPVPLREKNKQVKKTSTWLINSAYSDRKVYYYDPYFFFFMDKNPFDNTKIQERVPDPKEPEKLIKKGEIVIWDAHFAPNEGRLPLSMLSNNPNFQQIKQFSPKQMFKVLGDNEYQIVVFIRL